MKRFTYFASVVGREIECSNVNEVAEFANDVLQASLISPSMLYNYFSRPGVVNPNIIGPVGVLRVRRVENGLTPASSSPASHTSPHAGQPS
jgi:hypothetical protein